MISATTAENGRVTAMSSRACKNCDYFDPYSEDIAENCGSIGLCRRYPDYRNVSDRDWCGEFKTREWLDLFIEDMCFKPRWGDKK